MIRETSTMYKMRQETSEKLWILDVEKILKIYYNI